MALVDTSELLLDPDFADTVTLIRRSVGVNDYGENVMVETPCRVLMVVQGTMAESLDRLPEGARLSDLITVYFRGRLQPEAPDGYADVIVWNGRRYQVKSVTENFMNWGRGFTKAVCALEPPHA